MKIPMIALATCLAVAGVWRPAGAQDGVKYKARLQSAATKVLAAVLKYDGTTVLGRAQDGTYLRFTVNSKHAEELRAFNPQKELLAMVAFAKRESASLYDPIASSFVKRISKSEVAVQGLVAAGAISSQFTAISLQAYPGVGDRLLLRWQHGGQFTTEYAVDLALGGPLSRVLIFSEIGRIPVNSPEAQMGAIDIIDLAPATLYTVRMRAITPGVAIGVSNQSPKVHAWTSISGSSMRAIMTSTGGAGVPQLPPNLLVNSGGPVNWPFWVWQDQHPFTGRMFRMKFDLSLASGGTFWLYEITAQGDVLLDQGTWLEAPAIDPRSNQIQLTSPLRTRVAAFYWDADPSGNGYWNANALVMDIAEIGSGSWSKTVSLEYP